MSVIARANEMSAEVTFNFNGKKAIVTGGGRGIGREIVRALTEAKCSTIYVLDKAGLDRLKEDFPCVQPICVDLRDWDATRKAVQDIEPVNFLVNNAGIYYPNDIHDFTKDQFEDIADVNLKAMINISQVICAKMPEGSAVVNISSQSTAKQYPFTFTYAVMKHALDGATKLMAMSCAPRIRVNAVRPNLTMTEMGKATPFVTDPEVRDKKLAEIPMKRYVEVHEVSSAVLFLLSSGAGMTTGHLYSISGGE